MCAYLRECGILGLRLVTEKDYDRSTRQVGGVQSKLCFEFYVLLIKRKKRKL